jgi:hypothetical protein
MDEVDEPSPPRNRAIPASGGTNKSADGISSEPTRSNEHDTSSKPSEAQATAQPASIITAFEELRRSFEDSLNYLVRRPDTLQPASRGETRADTLLARYVELHGALSTLANAQLYRIAIIGIDAFSANRLRLADRIATELEFKTSTSAALSQVMRGLVRFLIYLLSISLLAVLFSSWFFVTNADDVKRQEAFWAIMAPCNPVVIAFFGGCLGGVVSLLLRLGEFEVLTGRSRKFLDLTGFTLPLVGGIFAAVTASLFSSNIINVNVREVAAAGPPNLYLFFVIGFLAGFSERFTRGLLHTAENTLGTGTLSDGGRDSATAQSRGASRRRRPGTDANAGTQS